MAHVEQLIVISDLALIQEGEEGIDMVRQDLVLGRIIRIEWELERLIFRLFLLRLEHIEELDILFRVQHAT